MVSTPSISQRAKSLTAADAPRQLSLFNARAEELKGAPFLAAVRAGRVGWSGHWERGKTAEVFPNYPDEWDIRSYALPFRLFFQDRDRFSFNCLSQLYPKLDISNCLKVRAGHVQGYVRRHLDLSQVILDGEEVGHKQIFDTVMYGGLAHVNEDKQPLHDRWASHRLQKTLAYSQFVETLVALTQAIFWMSRVNRDALQELGVPRPPIASVFRPDLLAGSGNHGLQG